MDEVDVNSKYATALHREFDPPGGKIYTLEILMAHGRPFHYFFTTAADRDAMYSDVCAALVPSVTIVNTAPDVPRKPKELDAQRRDAEGNKLYTRDEVFCTREEFGRAIIEVVEKEKLRWEQENQTTPPTPRAPRKPYTRKPRE